MTELPRVEHDWTLVKWVGVWKMSRSLRGRKLSAEHRENLSAAMRLRMQSPEARMGISAALRGRVITPEWREKLSASNRVSLVGNQNVRNAKPKGFCVYCFDPAATTYDHVIPRGRPGWDDPDNLVVCCLRCNIWKGQRTPEEWFTDSAPYHRA
jgi:5-methylcytosine-specific restriction endonuclease McrA